MHFLPCQRLIAFRNCLFYPLSVGYLSVIYRIQNSDQLNWVGFQNYINAFTENNNFINAAIFTIKFAIVSVVLINVFAFGLALLLTRAIRGTNLYPYRVLYAKPYRRYRSWLYLAAHYQRDSYEFWRRYYLQC